MEDDAKAVTTLRLDPESHVGAQVDEVFGPGLSAEQRESAVQQFEAVMRGEYGIGLELLLGGSPVASDHVIDEHPASDELQKVTIARRDRRGHTVH